MVNVAQTVSSGVSGAALYARASAASAVLSSEPVEAAQAPEAAANLPAEQTVVSAERAYRYNSFEFSYRQDFGKIVLIRQKPDTGEVVQQFPSEYYLRKYADGQRVAQSAVSGETPSGPQSGQGGSNVPSGSGALQGTPTQTATAAVSAPTPAPSVPSAPALPSGGTAASSGSAGPVNLTV